MFETYRHFVTFFIEAGSHPVEHVGGRQVADHSAALAAHLVQIPVDQQEQVVGGDVAAFLVNDGDPVGVAVGGQAQVKVTFFKIGDQQSAAIPDQAPGNGRQKAGCGVRG